MWRMTVTLCKANLKDLQPLACQCVTKQVLILAVSVTVTFGSGQHALNAASANTSGPYLILR